MPSLKGTSKYLSDTERKGLSIKVEASKIVTASLREQIKEILAPLQGREIVLIPALQAVQEKVGYLPEEALEEIGRVAGVSPNVVYGVASFYAQFRFIKPGEHVIKVCLGTACHVRGAASLVESLERELGV
ncbi:MAG TPA: hypothetical protein EYP71_05830, partial [Dehalococcoidia bacterium]|nr:hypothetical protein [Dehalococcoidia bacterium]